MSRRSGDKFGERFTGLVHSGAVALGAGLFEFVEFGGALRQASFGVGEVISNRAFQHGPIASHLPAALLDLVERIVGFVLNAFKLAEIALQFGFEAADIQFELGHQFDIVRGGALQVNLLESGLQAADGGD